MTSERHKLEYINLIFFTIYDITQFVNDLNNYL